MARTIYAVLGLLLLPSLVYSQAAGQKLALLVGIKEYEHAGLDPLKYTENDVADLATILKASGYKVVLMTETTAKEDPALRPTLKNIRQQLQALVKGGRRHDLAVVALSGHGIQFDADAESFFCPADARPTLKEKDTLLAFSEILKTLDDNGVGIKLLMADACRNDPNNGRGIDTRSIRPPKGSGVFLSCSKGQRAFENADLRHGVFFHYVLEGLKGKAINTKGEITWSSLTEYVAENVTTEVPRIVGEGARQEPNAISDFNGKAPLLVGKTQNPEAVAAMKRGDGFFDKQDYPQALVEYTKAVQIDPSEPELLNRKARALLSLREFEKAEKELDAAIKINPLFDKAHHNKGASALDQRQYDRAIGHFNTAIEINPRADIYWINRGKAQSAKGEHDKALKDADTAIRLNPNSSYTHANRGYFLYVKKDYTAALQAYDRALQIKPRDVGLMRNRADVFIGMKEFDKAIEELNGAVEINSRDANVLNLRGWLHLKRKDYSRAIQDCTKAIEIEPARATFWSIRGDAHFESRDLDQAIKDYDESLRLNDKQANVWNQRGRIHHGRKEFARAIDDYSNAIRLDPANSVFWRNRADCQVGLKNYDKALGDVNKAIELSPKDGVAFNLRGIIHENKQDYRSARNDYSKAIEFFPTTSVYWSNRAGARYELEEFDLALKDSTEAVRLNNKNGRAWNQCGRVHHNFKKDHANALNCFSQAIMAEPNEAVYYANRALAHEALGNTDLAAQDKEKVKQLRSGK